MNNRQIIMGLNEISENSETKILKQITSIIIVGLIIGLPDHVYSMMLDFHERLHKRGGEKDIKQIIQYEKSIYALNSLFQKTHNEELRLMIGVLIISIASNELEQYRNILIHINHLIEGRDFETDISTEGKTIH